MWECDNTTPLGSLEQRVTEPQVSPEETDLAFLRDGSRDTSTSLRSGKEILFVWLTYCDRSAVKIT